MAINKPSCKYRQILNQLLKNAPWVLRGNINTYNPINADNMSLLNIFLLSLKK